MGTSDLSSYSERQNRTVQRVLDDLDRWDERLAMHYGRQRDHERRTFRAMITVVLPSLSESPDAPPPASFQAWGRNISCGGLSFVHPQRLRQKQILVCLNPNAASETWFHGNIVRARQTQEDFWEYGVQFQGRVVDDSAAANRNE